MITVRADEVACLWGSKTRIRALTCAFVGRRRCRSCWLGDHAVVCDLRLDQAGVGAGDVPGAWRGGQGPRVAGAASRGRGSAPSGHPSCAAAGGAGAARGLFAATAPILLGHVPRHPGYLKPCEERPARPPGALMGLSSGWWSWLSPGSSITWITLSRITIRDLADDHRAAQSRTRLSAVADDADIGIAPSADARGDVDLQGAGWGCGVTAGSARRRSS